MTNPVAGGPPLKVLHVAQTAQGGVGSYLEEIIALQIERYGCDAVRAVLPDEHVRAFPRLLPRWLLPFPMKGAGRLVSSCRMALRAMTVVREWHPDIVHLHSSFAGLVLRPLIGALPHRPGIVYCPHGWAFDRKTGKAQTLAIETMERLLSRLCDAIVCVSANDFDRAAGLRLPASRLRVVLNGISDLKATTASARRDPWPEGARRILFVGRLDLQKGVDVLFSAMERLGNSAFAVVVGSSVVGGEALARRAPPNVAVVGWLSRSEIGALYGRAEVLAMPSRWEGLPIVAIEAMRAGLPVVATRVGGLPEIVEDGVSGRLIDSENPEQLARVLASLDTTTLRQMGANARRRYLGEFQVDRVVRELDGLYRDVASRLADPRSLQAQPRGGRA